MEGYFYDCSHTSHYNVHTLVSTVNTLGGGIAGLLKEEMTIIIAVGNKVHSFSPRTDSYLGFFKAGYRIGTYLSFASTYLTLPEPNTDISVLP